MMRVQRDTPRQTLSDQALILAFDVGGTRIKAGLVRGDTIKSLSVEPLNKSDVSPDLLRTLVKLGNRLRGHATIQAIGVSMKGIVNPQEGVLLDVNETWADLIGKPFAQLLSQEFDLPVFIENDARMYTVGEMLYGAGRSAENLLCLTLGTGIGSGVALQRRVLRGPRGLSGIMGGHITVQVDGPCCTCGNLGCLEAFIGNAALARYAATIMYPSRGRKPKSEAFSPKAIFAAALEGDAAAKDVVAYFTRYLGAGIVSLIHAYDPDLVVLGGGVAGSSAQFLPIVQRYVNEHTWTWPRGRVHVATSTLGDAAALLGISAYARGLQVLL